MVSQPYTQYLTAKDGRKGSGFTIGACSMQCETGNDD